MEFQHVDVFADTPYAGNSVTVFLTEGIVAAGQMLAITQEFRHFESIFLWPAAADSRRRARVFDLEGELDLPATPSWGPRQPCTIAPAVTRRGGGRSNCPPRP